MITKVKDPMTESNAILSLTLAEATAKADAIDGLQVRVKDRSNSLFEYKTGLTPNTFNVIQHNTLNLQLDLVIFNDVFLSSFGVDTTGASDATNGLLAFASQSAGRNVKFDNSPVLLLSESVNFINPESVDFGNSKVNYNRIDTETPITIGEVLTTLKHTFTSEVPRYTENLTVGDVSGMDIDSMLSIYNPVDSSWSGFRADYRQSEYQFIADISGSSVRLKSSLLDTYPIGSELYLLKSTRVDIKGKIDFLNTGSYGVCYGLNISGVVDSDFTSLAVSLDNGTHALQLNRCANNSGSNMCASQLSATISGLNYGIIQNQCVNNTFEGRFHGERHGSSTGTDGSAGGSINRFLTVRGRITSSGNSVPAADLHGNSEHCAYGGYMEGAALGGHNSLIEQGSVIVSPPGGISALLYTELKSTKHTAKNIQIMQAGAPTARGAIDVAGNATNSFDSRTTIGGTFDFSDNHVIAPNITGSIVKIANRGSAVDYKVNVRGLTIDSPASVPFNCKSVSGAELADLMMDENNWKLGTVNSDPGTVLHGVAQYGTINTTTPLSSSFVQSTVNYPNAFPSGRIPVITASSSKGIVDSAVIATVCSHNDSSTSGRINLTTVDGSDFLTETAIQIKWKAEVS